jgi:hypothetical protein
MLNISQIAAAVQTNCHISDAQFAGDYTLCVFLLKMREFYRWENRIPLTGVLPRETVGRWMQEREQMWERLEASEFLPVMPDAVSYDPFDAAGINRELVPQGYVYSAGYGRFGKPHFFLGTLVRQETRNGISIFISAGEQARDLVAPPAMLQNGVIYLRQESLRRFLWERVEEWRWNRGNDAMARAMASYDFEHDTEAALSRMTEVETESVILHEVGEALAERQLGEAWPRMLADLARSRAEIVARAVRDILADCFSTLPGLIERDHPAALHFYFANLGGMRRHIFPEAMAAYRRWQEGEVTALAALVRAEAPRWLATAQQLLALHRQYGADAGPAIEALFEHAPGCPAPAAH